MVYCETIESSKTWTCPKTGVWKVICIGGGGAGYGYGKIKSQTAEYTTAAGTAGGITSFGSYLSASGGKSGTERSYVISQYIDLNGRNGYNGIVEYGSIIESRKIGLGYGASGCGYAKYDGTIKLGDIGEVKVAILDISANTQVICTIGKGGEGAEKFLEGSSTEHAALAFPGSSGAIILQYLGSSM